MKKILTIIFPFIAVFILVTCNVAENEKPEMNEVEQFFRATVNGAPWSGGPQGGITLIQDDILLNVFAYRLDTLRWPYRQQISFSVDYDSNISDYPLVLHYINEFNRAGGRMYEIDGDAFIADYNAVEDSVNSFNINVIEEEDGHNYAVGSFA